MSTLTVVHLVCDSGLADRCANRTGETPRAAGAPAVRLAARQAGWFRNDGRLDICPACGAKLGLWRIMRRQSKL